MTPLSVAFRAFTADGSGVGRFVHRRSTPAIFTPARDLLFARLRDQLTPATSKAATAATGGGLSQVAFPQTHRR